MQDTDSKNTEKTDEKRSAFLTVQDVELAIIHFTWMTGVYPLIVIAHEVYHGWKGGWETTYLILRNVPIFFAIATTLIFFKEGVDIMLRRWQEARKISQQERAAIVEAAKAEGMAQGIEQGIEQGVEQGVEQGRAEKQRQWQQWYQRQMEARAKGEPFTEPPPTLNGDTPEE